jgi:hypothetical protein
MSNTTKYKDEILKVIKEKKIAFFDHSFAFTSFSRATAYNHGLDKLDDIRAAIDNNRVTAKNYMLNKWIASDNPTLQISAMRLLADSEEHRKLNQSYVDHSNKGDKFADGDKIREAFLASIKMNDSTE